MCGLFFRVFGLCFKFGFVEEIHAEQARQIQDTKIQDILLSQGFFISCILYLRILYLFAKQQFENHLSHYVSRSVFKISA